METFNETENALKYGAKENDVIAQIFSVSEKAGIAFCIGNALKYYTRFHSESSTSNFRNLPVFSSFFICEISIFLEWF